MKNRFNWRHQYDLDRDQKEGDNCITECLDESLTQQQFANEADLNTIVRRYGIDKGPLPVAPLDPRLYGDFTNVPDLRTLLDLAHDAREQFAELPPKLRERFNNDPARLWDFVQDPENSEEAVRLGFLKREETPPEPPPPANLAEKTP